MTSSLFGFTPHWHIGGYHDTVKGDRHAHIMLKLNYLFAGTWYVAGTAIYVLQEEDYWHIDSFDVEACEWLQEQGLAQATASTRRELMSWLSLAAQHQAPPFQETEYASVKLSRLPDGSLTDCTHTFRIERVADRNGDTFWWMSHEKGDLPGGNWATSERTLREIRRRIRRFHECLAGHHQSQAAHIQDE